MDMAGILSLVFCWCFIKSEKTSLHLPRKSSHNRPKIQNYRPGYLLQHGFRNTHPATHKWKKQKQRPTLWMIVQIGNVHQTHKGRESIRHCAGTMRKLK